MIRIFSELLLNGQKRKTYPCLSANSKNDNSIPFEHALHANKIIGNSKLVELNNEWGHLFWIGSDSNVSISKTMGFITE